MALHEYKRATDEKNLVQDLNVEVMELLYVPYVEDEGDLSIGDGDPNKPGAVASVTVDGEVVLAVYQGDGTWEIVGSGTSTTHTPDPNLPQNPPLSYLNSTYPDAKPGDVVYYEGTNNIDTATCYAPGKWMYSTQYRAK